MNKYLIIPLSTFLFIACGPMGSAPKSEKYQTEMTLHKTRADLEEIKHDLHTQKMELNILEGKMLNQEDSVNSLKKDTFEMHQTKLDNSYQQILTLEKKISTLEKRQEEIHSNLQQLAQTSMEMNKALAQSKEKINEVERTLSTQAKSLGDMNRLKKNVERVSQFIEESDAQVPVEPYRVKMGDTLDTIAKNHGTTSDNLLKINHLDSKKVNPGQEILVPTTLIN